MVIFLMHALSLRTTEAYGSVVTTRICAYATIWSTIMQNSIIRETGSCYVSISHRH